MAELSRCDIEKKIYDCLYSMLHIHSVKKDHQSDTDEFITFVITLIPDNSNHLLEHKIEIEIPKRKSCYIRIPDTQESYLLPEDEKSFIEYLMLQTEFVITNHRDKQPVKN